MRSTELRSFAGKNLQTVENDRERFRALARLAGQRFAPAA
jgi:hypothetical protein